MKKVLFIAFYVPPRPGIGSLRASGVGRYLKDYGWEPVFVTPELPAPAPDGFRVIQTRYPGDMIEVLLKLFKIQINKQQTLAEFTTETKNQNILKKRLSELLKLFKSFLDYPDHTRLWIRQAIKKAAPFLERENVDAIISTSPPVSAHLIARKLQNTFKIPWAADFRDLWSQNHYLEYCCARMWLEKSLELKTIASANAIFANTDMMNTDLQKLHHDKKIFTIPNGYDPAEFCTATPDSDFTIRYFGNLYNGKRNPEPLFKAIKKLIDQHILEQNQIKIEFFGKQEPWIDLIADRCGVKDMVTQKGLLDRDLIPEKQRKSQILLQLGWADPGEKNTIPAKLYEYFAAQRPILALGGTENDMVQTLLTETNTGFKALTAEQTYKILQNWAEEYKKNNRVAFQGKINKIENYSQKKMAEKMANALDQIC